MITVCLLCGTQGMEALAQQAVSDGDANNVELILYADENEEEEADGDEMVGLDEIPAKSIELNVTSLSLTKGNTSEKR